MGKTAGCKPIIAWVGGKRQLLSVINERLPQHFNTYYEPFFGGGALFFDLCPPKAVVNDFNDQLVNMYEQIKTRPKEVKRYIDPLEEIYNGFSEETERAEFYYKLRDLFNGFILRKVHSPISAATFIFLNKTGHCGLYRINSKGEYNVSFGHKKQTNAYDETNWQNVSKALAGTKLLHGDFEKACADAKAGDFVFFDSPYYNTFDTYQKGGFSEHDHRRLASLFRDLTDRGVYCMLTNSNTEFIKTLYSDFRVEVVDVKRMINRNANKRTDQEIIVTNYPVSAVGQSSAA